jgi:hypothetical protein
VTDAIPLHRAARQFGDSEDNAVDNYTNRSPVPIFHILREVEVCSHTRNPMDYKFAPGNLHGFT